MNDFHLTTADIAIVAATILAVLGIGLWASRRTGDSAAEFFLASGRMPWWLIGMAFVSTSVSSEQIVGTVGQAYENGMGVANWEWFSLPVYLPVMIFFIPIYLKNRVATVPELLTRRFGPLCGDIYSWTMMAAYVFIFLVPVLYGGSLALSSLTGWNFYAVLWTMAAVVGTYTIKGGLGAIMWTDAFQCVMLLGGGFLLFFVALSQIPGGWSAMETAAPERFHLYRPPDDPLAPFAGLFCGAAGVFLFYQSTNQVMIQRVLSARSTWDGLMGIVFAGVINIFRPLVTCFLGFIVYHWIHELHRAPPLENIDETFPFALKTFAPEWGLRGIVLAGFLSAVMSTTSALTNATATIFSLDVYRRVWRKEATDRELVLAGRLAAAAALIVACLLAPMVEHFGGIFLYFQTGVTYVATPFISVILMGILWKRANYQGGFVGLTGGIVIIVALATGLPAIGVNLHWLYVAFIAQIIIMALVAVVSLATPPPELEKWEPFLWRPSVLAHYDDGVKRPWYQQVKLWFTIYAFLWISLYWYFW